MKQKEYSFKDYLLQPDTYYYRLKQVDLDGSYAFTRILNLKVEAKGSVKIFPNPVSSNLNIQSENALNTIEIVNVRGQKKTYEPMSTFSTQVDMSKYLEGVYTILVNGESIKVIK